MSQLGRGFPNTTLVRRTADPGPYRLVVQVISQRPDLLYRLTPPTRTVRTPPAEVADDGALAGTTPALSGALAGEVIDSGALAGTTPMPTGALVADAVDVPRQPPVLIVSTRRHPAYDPPGSMQMFAGPVEVAEPSGPLAATVPMPTGALTGTVVDVPARPSVLVVSRARDAARTSRPSTRVLSALVPGADFAALAGATPPLAGALTGDVVDTGALAGATPPAFGSLTTSTEATGALAGPTPALSGALAASVFLPGALAGTVPMPTGALAGVERIDGTLAGATPALSGALTGTVTMAGVLAGSTPRPVGALTTLPPTVYPLHAGTVTDNVARRASGAATDNVTRYAAGTVPQPNWPDFYLPTYPNDY